MKNRESIQQIVDQNPGSFFFYDLDALGAHLKNIQETLSSGIKVWYACKANPLSAVLETLKDHGFGVDVASLGELAQAHKAGLTGDQLIATGPAKSYEYLEKLLDAKVSTIIIESHNQLKWLNEICQKRNLKQDVLLRVQLEWADEVKSVLGGSSITPFGLGFEDWKKIRVSEFQNLNILGLHCFQWGNVLNTHQLESVWDQTLKSCTELSRALNLDLQVMDLGGGLGVSYKKDGVELHFSEVHSRLKSLKEKYRIPEIWLELGRFSVANYGQYVTQIVDIKSVRGNNIIVTDGGINHIARPALTGEAFPSEALSHSTSERKTYYIHGPLCTALDFLGEHLLPEGLQVGEWIVFDKVGAYGFTESMPYFLCHSLAGEYLRKNGTIVGERKKETDLAWVR